MVRCYKSLADVERGFRVLKSEIEIGPVFHRLPDRIRAHASICFLALILYRVMRQRLSAAETGMSPERALDNASGTPTLISSEVRERRRLWKLASNPTFSRPRRNPDLSSSKLILSGTYSSHGGRAGMI